MSDDLFPGFDSHWIDTEAGRIFARAGGDGPPVVLVHGFPQTHAMWHRIAPDLAAEREPVHDRHENVGQQDIRPLAADLIERLAAVRGQSN